MGRVPRDSVGPVGVCVLRTEGDPVPLGSRGTTSRESVSSGSGGLASKESGSWGSGNRGVEEVRDLWGV